MIDHLTKVERLKVLFEVVIYESILRLFSSLGGADNPVESCPLDPEHFTELLD